VTGFPPHLRASTACSLRAFGVVEATAPSLAALRKQPGPAGSLPMPANLLNHAEDQTVAAMAAVLNAIDSGGLHREPFTDWAVVAAACFAGRVPMAAYLDKFRRLGPLSVSPTIIPFMSLHSTSSLISLALRIHGPALGVGGGSGEFAQALLTGLAVQQQDGVPGVWVVMTGWDPEPIPSGGAAPAQTPVCRAAVLALRSAAAGADCSYVRLVPAAESDSRGHVAPTLTALVRFLADVSTGQAGSWSYPVDGGWSLELQVKERGLLAKSA
jgi:hypothetical protein